MAVPGLFVPWTIRTLDCSYRGLFVPSWTVRTMDCSYRTWTFRTLDCSYRGLFVPSWTVRTMDYSYRPWTFRTMDCSYRGLFVPSLDDSYRDARLTKINGSYQNVPVFSVSQTPLNFSDIFPKRLGLFSPNFTFRLYIPIYARLQVSI